MKPLLIEIGIEELPAIPFLKEKSNIKSKWKDILNKYEINSNFKFFYTARRIVFLHNDFPQRQKDKIVKSYGAPVKIAYKEGKPTNAAIGFAKKCNIELAEIQTIKQKGSDILYHESNIVGKDIKEIIGVMIEEFLISLNFGKNMSWGNYKQKFIRPIRWIGVLYNNTKVKANIFHLSSSNITNIHRNFSYESLNYSSIEEYMNILETGKIVLNQDDRKKTILDSFIELEKQYSFKIDLDEELINEVIVLTEFPTVLLASFDKEFLNLPDEVIITSMKEHQRYFPIFENDKLINKFIVVSNSYNDNQELIVQGNEKVLKARLSDAMFFWENDIKNTLKSEGLKDVLFFHKAGSLYDKTLREFQISNNLYFSLDIKEGNLDLLEKTIMLSYTDLLSEMVYEFTELQGLMGYYYAKEAGEDNLLCLSLKEQYLPDSEDSELPSSKFSSIIALSKKIDSLLTLFSINQIPTSSKDPFALRRAVNGILKIVIANNFEFNYKTIFRHFSSRYNTFEIEKLEKFFEDRIYQFFGVNTNIIRAVLKSGECDILQIDKKIKLLETKMKDKNFSQMTSTFKRVANIIKDLNINEELEIDSSLFEKEEEKTLYSKFTNIKETDLGKKLDSLFALKPEIDSFFDNVMVNVENEKIKQNRKFLIGNIYKEFKQIVDIKELS